MNSPVVSAAERSGATTLPNTPIRGFAMLSMHEAFARERMRERERQARHAHLVHELAAVKRWRYLATRASAAHVRHTQRVDRVAEGVGVYADAN
jgi:hypothetical protein